MAQINLPSNSHSERKEPKAPPKKQVTQVTAGKVTKQKPSLGKRFKTTFFGDDAEGVWHYVAWDVLIPAAKDMLSDAVSQGVERLLFGEARGPGRNRRRGASPYGASTYTSYNRYSNGPVRSEYSPQQPQMSRRGRATHDFDELVFDSRADAEAVIDGLYEILATYDQATVADLYELAGVSGNFADEKWGWVDLKGSGVSRKRDGYFLDLPRPTSLN